MSEVQDQSGLRARLEAGLSSDPEAESRSDPERDKPYVGLRPYREDEGHRFFGRDAEQRILISKINANKLNLLLAASGVGKSSLLRAAVIPALRDSGEVDVVYHRDWAGSPSQDLKSAIAQEAVARGRLDTGYRPDPKLSLAELVRLHALLCPGLLLVVQDQFEEFFHYQRFSAERGRFLEELSAAIRDRDAATGFLIAMREDFAIELDHFKPYLSGVFDHYYRLAKLQRDQAEAAIRRPLEDFGYAFEPELTEILLTKLAEREWMSRDDLRNQQPELSTLTVEPPHLQIVCEALWQRRDRSGSRRLITRDDYQAAGGVEGILSGYFANKIEGLDRRQQDIASGAFDYLVSQHGTKMTYPLNELDTLLRRGRGRYREAAVQAWRLLTDTLKSIAGNKVRPDLAGLADRARRGTGSFAGELVAGLNEIGPERLQAALDRLCRDAILRRTNRQGRPWFELYHDLFARPIAEWNLAHKRRRFRERAVRTTLATIVFLLLAGAGLIRLDHAIHAHLQLSELGGDRDHVEVYHGYYRVWDPFGQRTFHYETPYRRTDLEPDKRFFPAPIPVLADSRAGLITRLPLVRRFPEYAANGLLDRGFKLAELVLASGRPDCRLGAATSQGRGFSIPTRFSQGSGKE